MLSSCILCLNSFVAGLCSVRWCEEPACKLTDPGAIIHNASLEKAFQAHVLFVVDECSDEGLVNPRLIQKITKGLSAALLGKGRF